MSSREGQNVRSMVQLRRDDVVQFQRNGQSFEHTGRVATVKTAYFVVTVLPFDPLAEKVMVSFSMDYWKIIERNGKPYLPPDHAGPICSAVPILETADDVDDPDVSRRKRFFGGPTKKGSRRKRARI
jgi:hypothetical protein